MSKKTTLREFVCPNCYGVFADPWNRGFAFWRKATCPECRKKYGYWSLLTSSKITAGTDKTNVEPTQNEITLAYLIIGLFLVIMALISNSKVDWYGFIFQAFFSIAALWLLKCTLTTRIVLPKTLQRKGRREQ